MARYGGAFEPKDDSEAEQRYLRRFGKDLPFISKVMLSLQDDPRTTREFYREHLTKAAESAAYRKVTQSLPVKDEGNMAKPKHNVSYMATKAALESKPKLSMASFYTQQCAE